MKTGYARFACSSVSTLPDIPGFFGLQFQHSETVVGGRSTFTAPFHEERFGRIVHQIVEQMPVGELVIGEDRGLVCVRIRANG